MFNVGGNTQERSLEIIPASPHPKSPLRSRKLRSVISNSQLIWSSSRLDRHWHQTLTPAAAPRVLRPGTTAQRAHDCHISMSHLPTARKPNPRPNLPPAPTATTSTTGADTQTVFQRLSALPRNLRHLLTDLVRRPSSNTAATSLRGRLPTLALYAVSTWCTVSLFRTYVLDWSLNAGASMVPTVSASGHTYTLYSGWYRRGRGIKVGDMVQIRQPFFEGMLAGKRVVGLPGDFVVRDKHGTEGVGGRIARGKVEGNGEEEEMQRQEPELIQVPEGHVWLAGDNLAWSRDSRFYGPVPMALIRAKALFVVDGLFLWRAVWREQTVKVGEDVH